MPVYQIPVISQFVWQPPVLDKDLNNPPGGESKGDRYIVAAGAGGAWAGEEENIAQYNGAGWDFIDVKEGMMTYVIDEDVLYLYITSWDEFSAGAVSPRVVEQKTDNYNVTVNDGGKTLEMEAAAIAKTFSLPSVTDAHKGLWFRFCKMGAGKVTIDAADSDIIHDSDAGFQIYNDEADEAGLASIVLELDYSGIIWMIVSAVGTWITTKA